MDELRYTITKRDFIQAFKERYKEEFPSLGLDDRAYFIAGFLEAGGVFERTIELSSTPPVEEKEDKVICSCGGGENNGHNWNCPWQENDNP